MGAIVGEELTNWEKMQRPMSGGEEKILVLVRLRPLGEKEIAKNEVSDWECINETTILFRNSLQERSMFPTAYTFDGVFGGDYSTRQVYDEGVKEIALSVVRGVNSSIFAYGQTSSGKTYTMVGVTEFAVADIYDYIQKHEERAFVLKFSAMEIYNEAIRDLLSTDITPLRVLDDPEKGTIVEKLTEATLRDWTHLKELLAVCEAQRKIGETSLNETSSRSHQILRLTIESSAREFLGKDSSTTLSASVNFVDLAGSERASQALSVGTRLKEGCHINRSLLTLGTVIRKLSKGRNGHVNYRDSKLTRILQPSLGGNARTAIICTLSPARSHVEQSRNTLLFATCAKEVSTNAKVNVVMSDKALVKHLQKELARLESELKTPTPSSTCNCAVSLRKKDLQIEKLEKEVRELSEKCDLAESRVTNLLHMVENDQSSKQQVVRNHRRKWHEGDKWDKDCSVSESSEIGNTCGIVDSGIILDNAHSSTRSFNRNSETQSGVDSCKEVRCVEMEDEESKSAALSISPREVNSMWNNSTYGPLEQRITSSCGDDTSPWTDHGISSSRNNLTRSSSCRGTLLAGSSSPFSVDTEEVQSTPPGGFEKIFPGRPEGFQKIVSRLSYDGADNLSRCDSQSSIGSAFVEELKAQKSFNSADEGIPTIDSFVAEMKEMAKLEYEKYQGTTPEGDKYGNDVKSVALDTSQSPSQTPMSWHFEFERRRKAILELWQACNVSLVHRTYFVLLFKGDPNDSIYMEVEFRRLSFLKEAFSQGNQAIHDGHPITLALSMKALRRERETLTKLMYKRFSEAERNSLYEQWGISLRSKRRRLQLVSRLWSDINDINRIYESATIVGKLIRFSEQGAANKEMFGLSFTPARISRRSFSWKNSKASLL